MNRKRITAIVLASCLAVCMVSPVFAAEYKYKVEVSEGLHGTISGETPIEVSKGTEWNPNDYTVTAKDGYYFKGFHKSGQEDLKTGMAQKITEDTTFVAAYGIESDSMVSYTIHYQDEDGNTLAEDRVFEGILGDKPVVAYQEIDGYMPKDSYNVTWELKSDKMEYTFVYIPSTTTTVNETTTTNTVTVPAATTTTAAATTTTGTAAGTAAGGAAAGGAAAGAAAGEGAAGPAELTDLDEGAVPLAGVDDENGGNGDGTTAEAGEEETINDDQVPTAGISTAAKAGIGVIIAAAIVAIIAALAVRARRRNKEDEV